MIDKNNLEVENNKTTKELLEIWHKQNREGNLKLNVSAMEAATSIIQLEMDRRELQEYIGRMIKDK